MPELVFVAQWDYENAVDMLSDPRCQLNERTRNITLSGMVNIADAILPFQLELPLVGPSQSHKIATQKKSAYSRYNR